MKILVILLLCGLLSPRVVSQSDVSQEQTSFGVEQVFQRPVPLPSAALQALRASKTKEDILQECAKAEGMQPSQIPASWFVASRIELDGASRSDFIVRGEHRCLMGAHSAHFWVLAKSATGDYSVVFRGFGDGLDVLSTRTNGNRDLQFTILTAVTVESIKFRYSDGSYRKSSDRIEHD